MIKLELYVRFMNISFTASRADLIQVKYLRYHNEPRVDFCRIENQKKMKSLVFASVFIVIHVVAFDI